MIIKQSVLIFLCCLAFSLAFATYHIVITDLDKHLIWIESPAEMQEYMRSRSLDSAQMMRLLDENIEEQLAFTDSPDFRDIAMSGTLYSMTYTDSTQSLARLLKYSEQEYPEHVRATASMLYIRHAGDAGFVLATNVMIQPWRSPREHINILMECYALAKSVSAGSRIKHVDFMKWALMNDRSGGGSIKTWDRYLNELDPSWRTNEMRKGAVEVQQTIPTTPTGTNILIEIIHDYEIAVGLRQSDSKAEQQTSSEPTDADIGNVPVLDVQSNTAQTPVPVSRTSIVLVLGVIIIASFIVYLIWKSRFK
jgi:hypothetical protein